METNRHLNVEYRSPSLSGKQNFSLELEQLKNGYEKIFCKKGEILFKEGNSPWGLYFIETGKVKLYKYGRDGKEQIIKIAHAGEFIGYTALLNDIKYNVSAAVLEATTLAYIRKQDFLEYFRESNSIIRHFTQLLCQDLTEAEQRITAMAYRPVRGRLAEALLSLDKIYKQQDKNKESLISLSRQDLASLLGTAKETVIRLLSEFKSEQLITTDGQIISVLNPKGLKKICHLYD